MPWMESSVEPFRCNAKTTTTKKKQHEGGRGRSSLSCRETSRRQRIQVQTAVKKCLEQELLAARSLFLSEQLRMVFAEANEDYPAILLVHLQSTK